MALRASLGQLAHAALLEILAHVGLGALQGHKAGLHRNLRPLLVAQAVGAAQVPLNPALLVHVAQVARLEQPDL